MGSHTGESGRRSRNFSHLREDDWQLQLRPDSWNTIKLTRIPTLRTVADFRKYVVSLGLDLPCDEAITAGQTHRSPGPSNTFRSMAKKSATATPSSRWKAGTAPPAAESLMKLCVAAAVCESGAKLIFGGEAMAVRPMAGQPNQLMISEGQSGAGETPRGVVSST